MTGTPTTPRHHLLLLGAFACKWAWDVYLLIEAGAGFSAPKLGVVCMLPPISYFVYKDRAWALNLCGVICLFWLAFVVAQLLGPMISVSGEVSRAFPWSNLIGLPGLVYVMNHLRED